MSFNLFNKLKKPFQYPDLFKFFEVGPDKHEGFSLISLIKFVVGHITALFKEVWHYFKFRHVPEDIHSLNNGDSPGIECSSNKKMALAMGFANPSTPRKGGNDTIPSELRLPKLHSGTDYTVYETEMDKVYGKEPEVFEELFKKHVAKYNNISGSIISFPSGPKHVYRSAMLAFSPDTLKELMLERGVKTIVHLSNKKTVNQKLWTQTEKEHFLTLGGKSDNYIHILDFDYLFNDEDELFNGRKKVAEIINKIEQSEGNVLIHCLGGEHKTELIFEVMQKCYNHLSMENIIERYKCHTAWSPDPKVKSGFKQNNLDFIRDFPSELLIKPAIQRVDSELQEQHGMNISEHLNLVF